MTDPAVEAARRAWVASGRVPLPTQQDLRGRISAAREALKPIREWFEVGWADYSKSAFGNPQLDLLRELAPLIFATEELNQ
ncbi:Uncharacterised protein [Mycobacteroides abscessus subsp. massiliense]|nr:Uncharacterised protein [Mycobacteroides abscessus subsp. massiliense]SKZ05770.1 Uncharacterised protein [Mycobacteroides abscessus subsp. massiliense]